MSGSAQARGAAGDKSGNVLVTGGFRGTVDFGGGPLNTGSMSEWDIFVAKFSGTDGSHLWSKAFGGTAGLDRNAIAVDASGNVLVTGGFGGTVDFGGGPLPRVGGENRFVVKLSGVDGSHLWSKSFGPWGPEYRLAADASGNVVVTGTFSRTVDFGGGPLLNYGSVREIFVAKLSGADGSHIWSKAIEGGVDNFYGSRVALDGGDSVLVTGALGGTAEFGGGPVNGSAFLLKLHP